MEAARHLAGLFQTALLLCGLPGWRCTRCPGAAQVVGVLKKEVMKTQSRDLEKGAEYRQLLVQVGRVPRG